MCRRFGSDCPGLHSVSETRVSETTVDLDNAASSELCENGNHFRLNLSSSDFHGPVFVNEHVDFTSNAKVRQVDARFDGEKCLRQYPSCLMGFQIVDVCAVAVGFLSHVVPGAVAELLTVTCVVDDFADRVVHLPALK